MEADGHDAVSCIERFLDTVSMMTVNVNVQHPWICSQKFKDSEHDVIDVTKARRLPLFSVMKAACPIDRNVRGA
jgi:hypothetical protein